MPGRAAAVGTSWAIQLIAFQAAQRFSPHASPVSRPSSPGAESQAVPSCVCARLWEARASPGRDIKDRTYGWQKTPGVSAFRSLV